MESRFIDLKTNRHMEDEEVERYSMNEMTEEESVPFEEHLLTCAACRTRVEEADAYVSAMAGAARQIRSAAIRDPMPRQWWMARPLWAATVAAAGIVILASTTDLIQKPEPLAVSLQAVRGTSPGAKVQANHPLLLTPDLTGIAQSNSYSLEIVNENGEQVFRAVMSQPPVKAPKLAAGIYFVRISSDTGGLLREYGLKVAR